VTLVGHSMAEWSRSFMPAHSRAGFVLVVLDGVTVLPNTTTGPAHERIAKYVAARQLDDRGPRRYRTIDEAAAQMMVHNKRLSPELGSTLPRLR